MVYLLRISPAALPCGALSVVIRLAGDSAPEAGVMVLTLAVGAAAATEWFALMDQCFHALLARRQLGRADNSRSFATEIAMDSSSVAI
jgi:hypothetical protein